MCLMSNYFNIRIRINIRNLFKGLFTQIIKFVPLLVFDSFFCSKH